MAAEAEGQSAVLMAIGNKMARSLQLRSTAALHGCVLLPS